MSPIFHAESLDRIGSLQVALKLPDRAQLKGRNVIRVVAQPDGLWLDTGSSDPEPLIKLPIKNCSAALKLAELPGQATNLTGKDGIVLFSIPLPNDQTAVRSSTAVPAVFDASELPKSMRQDQHGAPTRDPFRRHTGKAKAHTSMPTQWVCCRRCGGKLTTVVFEWEDYPRSKDPDQKQLDVGRVRRLPSRQWKELVGAWVCHTESYALARNMEADIPAIKGTLLFGNGVARLHKEDTQNLISEDSGWKCQLCRATVQAAISTKAPSSDTVDLDALAIAMHCSLFSDVKRQSSESAYVLSVMQAAIEYEGQYRFEVVPVEDRYRAEHGICLTVLATEGTMYLPNDSRASDEYDLSQQKGGSEARKVAKLMFTSSLLPTPEDRIAYARQRQTLNRSAQDGTAAAEAPLGAPTTGSVGTIRLPFVALQRLAQTLVNNHTLLPPAKRRLGPQRLTFLGLDC
eukprot:Clim_evm37s172 gene=Clim_evmTU37s172